MRNTSKNRRLEHCSECGRLMWLMCECEGPHMCRDCMNMHAVPMGYELGQRYLTTTNYVHQKDGTPAQRKVITDLRKSEDALKSVYIRRCFSK